MPGLGFAPAGPPHPMPAIAIETAPGDLKNAHTVLAEERPGFGAWAMAIGVCLLVWTLARVFFFVGFAFGLENVYDNLGDMAIAVILVTAVDNIGSSIPAAPGGIGLFELVATETLVFLPLAAVDKSVAAGFAAVVHLSLLLPMIILGQVFLWAENVSLRKLSRAGRGEEKLASVSPSAEGDNPL